MSSPHLKQGSRLSWLHGIMLVVVAAAAGTTLLLAGAKKKAEAREADQRTEELALGPVVQTAPVQKTPATRTVNLSGEVHAYRESTLYAKVSGYLKMVRVDKGE